MLAETLALLRGYLPAIPLEIVRDDGEERIVLLAAAGADYHYECHYDDVYDEHFALSLAAMIESPTEGSDRPCFWYKQWEIWRRQDADLMRSQFHQTLSVVVTSESRITQHRTLFCWNFHCDVWQDAQWRTIGEHVLLRGMWTVPRIIGRRHVYQSAPLTTCAFQ